MELNCTFHPFGVNMMIFHVNMFRLLLYDSQGDQFDGALVVTSNRYWSLRDLYYPSSCCLLYHTSEPEAFPSGMRTENVFGFEC